MGMFQRAQSRKVVSLKRERETLQSLIDNGDRRKRF